MTIHITPEPECSYVSFESNVAASNYVDLIARVIKLFQPGRFVVTIFANKVSIFLQSNSSLNNFDRDFTITCESPSNVSKNTAACAKSKLICIHRHLRRMKQHMNWIIRHRLANGHVTTSNTVASKATI